MWVRVLLDNCVPHGLRHELSGHDVQTARFAGLEGLTDPSLLAAMAGVFDVLVPCDQGIPWQSKIDRGSIAVVMLCAATNRLADLRPLVPALIEVLKSVQPGEVREIGGAEGNSPSNERQP